MRRALREFKIVGVSTNIPFHLQVMEDAHFIQGKLDTTFVERRFQGRRENGLREEQVALLAAAILARRRGAGRRPAGRDRPGGGWRMRNRPGRRGAGTTGWQRSF